MYLRFFSLSPLNAEREAKRGSAVRPTTSMRAARLAGRPAGRGGQLRAAGPGRGIAEIAFAVSDHMHGRGVATLLLDHLVLWPRRLRGVRGVHRADAGRQHRDAAGVRRRRAAGAPAAVRRGDRDSPSRSPPTRPTAGLRQLPGPVAGRESRADVASLRHLLGAGLRGGRRGQPEAGRVGRPRSLRNIVDGGFAGRVYAVNPHAPTRWRACTACRRSPTCPEPPTWPSSRCPRQR